MFVKNVYFTHLFLYKHDNVYTSYLWRLDFAEVGVGEQKDTS